MRGNPKAVAWRERRAPGKVGMAERRFAHDAPPVRERHDAARLLVPPHLELEPALEIISGRVQPPRHQPT
jgi:hypothetical protein